MFVLSNPVKKVEKVAKSIVEKYFAFRKYCSKIE
jgi:hypothetical protein